MRRTVIIVVSVIMTVTAEAFAQSAERDLTVSELQKQLAEMRSQISALQNRVAILEAVTGDPETSSSTQSNPLHSQTRPLQPIRSQPDDAKSAGEPTAFHFKGLTVTPGGFLDSTVLLRTRNENADLANSYSAIPLDGSSNANLSEFRGTARNSGCRY
jgi:type II secretory pathway pseudopilin PulG